MSADNWAICPRCLEEARQVNEAEHGRVAQMYGVVPAEEWKAALEAIKAVSPEDFRTFREDYEIYGAETGEIKVSYSGHCSKCDLGTDFEDSRRFWSPADEEVT